jgi:hypothetical protein
MHVCVAGFICLIEWLRSACITAALYLISSYPKDLHMGRLHRTSACVCVVDCGGFQSM